MSVQSIIQDLITYAPFIIGCAILGPVMFAGGFFYANRSRAKRLSEPNELEQQLTLLEKCHKKLISAVVRLQQSTRIPTPKLVDQPNQPMSYVGPGKLDGVKRSLAAKPDSLDPAIHSRFKELRMDYEEATTYLNIVSEYFERGLRPAYQQTVPGNNPTSGSGIENIQSRQVADRKYSEVLGQVQENSMDFRAMDIDQDFLNTASELINHYNRAVLDGSVREEFREKYQPVRVGTVNAEERTANPTVPSQFRETTDGDFFAISLPEKDSYVVLPRLGLTIEAISYGPGALGEVFEKTRRYDPQHFYSRYRVVSQAIFKRNGQEWTLIKPGELDLGLPD